MTVEQLIKALQALNQKATVQMFYTDEFGDTHLVGARTVHYHERNGDDDIVVIVEEEE